MADTGTCRSCGAAILWVTMIKTGKKNPLNAAPDPERGNVRILDGGHADILSSDAAVCRAYAGELYLSHFATCVSAAQHRKPK